MDQKLFLSSYFFFSLSIESAVSLCKVYPQKTPVSCVIKKSAINGIAAKKGEEEWYKLTKGLLKLINAQLNSILSMFPTINNESC